MDKFKPRGRPEAKVQKSIIEYLRNKEWLVMATHGNQYQHGFPDLFCTHTKYGPRWVEVKLPGMKGSKYTAAQLEYFPKLCANGSGVWVMTAPTVAQYTMLVTEPPNWWQYLSTARKV